MSSTSIPHTTDKVCVEKLINIIPIFMEREIRTDSPHHIHEHILNVFDISRQIRNSTPQEIYNLFEIIHEACDVKNKTQRIN